MPNEVIPMLLIVGGVIALLWRRMQFRHTERMEMLAQGLTPDHLQTGINRNRDSLVALKWGLLVLCAGTGFLVGFLIQHYVTHDSDQHPALMFSGTFIAGGIGLLIYYRIANARKEEESARQV